MTAPSLSLRGVASAERIKLRNLPSAVWLLVSVVATLVVAGVVPALGVALGVVPPGSGGPSGGALSGLDLAVLLAGAFGVVAVSSEYSSRTIISTLTAVPRRLPVLAAKAAVTGAVATVSGIAAVLVTLLADAVLLAAADAPVPVAGPTLARLVVGAGLQMGVTAVLGVAFGFLLRSTAGGVAVLVGFLLVPSVLGLFVPAVLPYLPSSAASAVVQVDPGPGGLGPWTGMALYAGYAAAGLVTAGLALTRRDA